MLKANAECSNNPIFGINSESSSVINLISNASKDIKDKAKKKKDETE
jgi:hypothetical protein